MIEATVTPREGGDNEERVGDVYATCPKCKLPVTKVWIGGMDGDFFWKHCGEFFTPTQLFKAR